MKRNEENMSKFNMETMVCPKCKTEQKIKVWESVNVTQSPKEKERILKGEFFRFACKKCDMTAPLAYNCLYNDMDKKLLVWLIPELTDEVEEKLASAETIADDDKSGLGYIYRIVETPNELKEKIMINDAGLDDRIVELLKMIYMSQMADITGDKTIAEEGITEMLLDVKGENDFAFVIFFEKREPLMIDINYDVYIKVYEDFIELVEEVSEEKFTRVDFQWAKKIFSLKNDKMAQKS